MNRRNKLYIALGFFFFWISEYSLEAEKKIDQRIWRMVKITMQNRVTIPWTQGSKEHISNILLSFYSFYWLSKLQAFCIADITLYCFSPLLISPFLFSLLCFISCTGLPLYPFIIPMSLEMWREGISCS